MKLKLPPLPAPDGRWSDDPTHPMSTPVDPVKTYSGRHSDAAMTRYGEACARAALDAALHACNGTQMLVAGHHPWTALQAQKRIGDAIRALSIELER